MLYKQQELIKPNSSIRCQKCCSVRYLHIQHIAQGYTQTN